jgi:anti-sigma-K factor RskA
MRRSLAQFETAFREQAVEERTRREHLRREAATRSRVRRRQKAERNTTLRFFGLVLAIIATTILVTIAMFEALARVVG